MPDSPTGRLKRHEPQPQFIGPPSTPLGQLIIHVFKGGRIAGLREKYGPKWEATLVHFGTWEYSGPIYGHHVEISPYCAGVNQWDESTGTVWRAFYRSRGVGSGATPLDAANQAARVLFGEGLRIKPGDALWRPLC